MKYFDKDFWKFAFQFVLVISMTMIVVTFVSGYLMSGQEASVPIK